MSPTTAAETLHAFATSEPGPRSEAAAGLDPDAWCALGEDLARRCAEGDAEAEGLAHVFLDLVRYPAFLGRIAGDVRWERLLCDLVASSHYALGVLFEQRARTYPDKPLFSVLKGEQRERHTWREVAAHVATLRAGLAALRSETRQPEGMVAFLMGNSLEMALLDLACLTGGIVDVMIPANVTADHLVFILEQTRAPVVLVAGDPQIRRLAQVLDRLPDLERIVVLDTTRTEGLASARTAVRTLEDLREAGAGAEAPAARCADMEALATVMYTSGTTGLPKGIAFSQLNIVSKRFCRALALPAIGDGDRFLSYLPLYHTFGRWLEMTGSLFWGAEYTFLENPAIGTIAASMGRVRPTLFISVPEKWKQLHGRIAEKVDVVVDADETVRLAVLEVTGGALKWGLSAAGWLSPEIFRFFQRYGVELMSGFGMTEATGGITMTPPGRYREESLGLPLPGVECRLAEDGELLVRGPYVTTRVLGGTGTNPAVIDGWLHTGDLMQADADGFLQIVDRKKAIYKNTRGETIAPQRIEKLFEDLESVDRAFLVGDHRRFNTLLIQPNWDGVPGLPRRVDDEEVRAFFSSLVVGVNAFLAPYERVVDFRLVERPFSAEHGELTPKGSFKRRVIERNFTDLVEEMYVREHTSVDWNGLEVRVPTWFLREHGCLGDDVVTATDGLRIPKLDRVLPMARPAPGVVAVGDYLYTVPDGPLDLGLVLTSPLVWLGNATLVRFAGSEVSGWQRGNLLGQPLRFRGTLGDAEPTASDRERFAALFARADRALEGLHLAVLHLRSPEPDDASAALAHLRTLLPDPSEVGVAPSGTAALVQALLQRPTLARRPETREEMLVTGFAAPHQQTLEQLLAAYADLDPPILRETLVPRLAEVAHSEPHLRAIAWTLDVAVADETRPIIPALLQLLVHFCRRHPSAYRRIRQEIVEHQVRSAVPEIRRLAGEARETLRTDLRRYLGDNKPVAIDPDTGREYRWAEVIGFEDGIDAADQERLRHAIAQTSVVREAVFLFSGGRMIDLHDILPGGIWVSLLGIGHGKRVYRVSVQTRHLGAYDVALNLNDSLGAEEIRDEVDTLVLAGWALGGARLVEDFGGWWPDLDLWSEEYVSGETVARYLERFAKRDDPRSREALEGQWPLFVWSAAETYVALLERTGFALQLPDPDPRDIVVPPHDYQSDTRLVSVASRRRFSSLGEYLQRFHDRFVAATEARHPFLHRDDAWDFVFAGVVEAVGEQEGIALLEGVRRESAPVPERLDAFLAHVAERGFMSRRLYFAVRRFRRWLDLARDADLAAQARTLAELSETYGLKAVESVHPGTRTRFFLETVFRDSDPDLVDALRRVARRQRTDGIPIDEAVAMFTAIQDTHPITEREAFFLARIGYPHLRPTDQATLQDMAVDGSTAADLVVQLEDRMGEPFWVRAPSSPREISRLHHLFAVEKLKVDFRPEHRFLVAISDRGHLIGGLFYLHIGGGTAHMDKLVVSHHFRRRGISQGLMQELFDRLRDQGIRQVTTGFFRPAYFYRLGFRVAGHVAGLVRDLDGG